MVPFFVLVVLATTVLSNCMPTTSFAETYDVPQTAEVTLAWDPVEPIPDGYRLYQRKEGQSYDDTQPCWTGADTTGTVYNLEWDTTYYFVVRAYVSDQESANSNEVTLLSGSQTPPSFTLSVVSGENGVVSPANSVTLNSGTDQTFTITPDAGYHVSDVKVDGVSVGSVSAYTFSQVSADHTLEATFAIDSHTITASSGTNGTIDPAGTVSVNHGSTAAFAITPDAGYAIEDVLVDGSSVGAVSSYTFNQVITEHTIQAVFEADTFTITSTAGENGTISPLGSVTLQNGSSQTFAITPDDGYAVSFVLVDGVSMGLIDAYTFSAVSTDHSIAASFALDNQAPVADAGPDQKVDEGKTAMLSGLNSDDPDDGIASYQWHQIQGIPVVLNAPNDAETTFTTPNVDSSGAALVFELTVTDYTGSTATDTCIVNVTWVNTPPVADAGVDQTVNEKSQVALDATTSTDADDGIASYVWKQLSGPIVALSGENSASPTFTTPDVGTEDTSLTFQVTVTDAGGLQDTDTCVVNVTWVNTPPVADAGGDQTVAEGEDVFLDGSKSADADDPAITSYRWSQTTGTPVELSAATTPDPMFIVPTGAAQGWPLTFALTVTDSGGLQGVDHCQINVQPTESSLYVSGIRMALKQKGKTVEANAYISIVDTSGTIVKDAAVTGKWSYNETPLETATATTKGEGVARLYVAQTGATTGSVFTMEILGVVKEGYTYDASLNQLDQDSLAVP
jgi:hypothetical protein